MIQDLHHARAFPGHVVPALGVPLAVERVDLDPVPPRAPPDPLLVARPREIVDRVGVDHPGARQLVRAPARRIAGSRSAASIPDRDRAVSGGLEPRPDGIREHLRPVYEGSRVREEKASRKRDPDVVGSEVAVELRAQVLLRVPSEPVVRAHFRKPLRREDSLPRPPHPFRNVGDDRPECETDDHALPRREHGGQRDPGDRVVHLHGERIAPEKGHAIDRLRAPAARWKVLDLPVLEIGVVAGHVGAGPVGVEVEVEVELRERVG